MKAFAELYAALDRTTKTNAKVAALKRYLAAAAPEDAAWAVHFLIGRRPKRLLESRKLAQWAMEEAGVPDWLFGECYHAVGDFAETIALLLPPAEHSSALPLHYWMEERLLPLREADDETRRAQSGRRLARVGRGPALRLEQADHRRIPRGRLADAWWCAPWPRPAASRPKPWRTA